MQSVFSEILSFTVTIKPEIERAIHNFSAGGGQTGDIEIFISAFFEDVKHEPPMGDSKNIPLGMTVLDLQFPVWLANADYYNIYDPFTMKLKELGLEEEGPVMRKVITYTDLDKASLIREAIKILDNTCEIAKSQFETKKGK
jgi:hypothetical protein